MGAKHSKRNVFDTLQDSRDAMDDRERRNRRNNRSGLEGGDIVYIPRRADHVTNIPTPDDRARDRRFPLSKNSHLRRPLSIICHES